MTHFPEALTWCLAAGTTATVVMAPLLAGARRRAAALRSEADHIKAERDALSQQKDQAEAQVQALLQETTHLVHTRIPAMTAHLTHRHLPVPGPLHTGFEESVPGRDHQTALEQVAHAVAAERERVDEAAQAAMRGATTVMQAMSYQMQSVIVEMQERYDDPQLTEGLLALDQLNEQNLRRIQATGVLCGAWPGLSRADSHLGDVVVGAKSRVRGFHRIQVTSQLSDPVGVVSRAVEPIAITVTELLANAVHHSHGTLAVDVSLHQTSSGACVVIDDAGVGMHPDEIEYATRMMSGQQPVRLSELGDPPRGGFATIGRLTRQFGFAVSVDKPAPYGGVRAVVFIPGHLLTLMEEDAPMSVSAPLSPHVAATPPPGRTRSAPPTPPTPAVVPATPAFASAAPDSPAHHSAASPSSHGSTPSPEGLPRRRRRHAVPATTQETPASQPAAEHHRTPEQTGATWSSFQAGLASGRAAVQDSVPTEPREGDSA